MGAHIDHEDYDSHGRRAPGANSACATSVADLKTEGVARVNIEGSNHILVRVTGSFGGGFFFVQGETVLQWHGVRRI